MSVITGPTPVSEFVLVASNVPVDVKADTDALGQQIVGAISDRDVKRAERLVIRNAVWLRGQWARIHGHE